MFNVHFTGVTNHVYTSPTAPSVHLSTARWDDPSEIESSTYPCSSYHTNITSPSHQLPSNSIQPSLANASSHIPSIYPYLYHHSTPVGYSPSPAASHYVLSPMFQVAPSNGNTSVQSSVSPQANIVCVSPVIQVDSNWYPDSDATNHLTHDTQIPKVTTTYTCLGKVLVKNGFSLRISAIGSSIIPTDSKQLFLNNMLYTPCVTKNLLSMSQFANENQVYFEFHASHCLVKYYVSHRVLLKGFEFNGLYKLDLSAFLSMNSVTNTSHSHDSNVELSANLNSSTVNNIVVSANNDSMTHVDTEDFLDVTYADKSEFILNDVDDVLCDKNSSYSYSFHCLVSSLCSKDSSNL